MGCLATNKIDSDWPWPTHIADSQTFTEVGLRTPENRLSNLNPHDPVLTVNGQ